MAVFNWLIFIVLFLTCIVYVTPKPPKELCYMIGGETKCFSNGTPFDNTHLLPEHPQIIPTTFRLYTRGLRAIRLASIGNESSSFIPDNNTLFDSRARTVFITHGWHGYHYQDWIIKAKNRILAATGANVITVDWSNGASRRYFQAIANSRVAGSATAHIMKVLHKEFGANYSDMHVIGWSLGAHVAGYAAEEIKSTDNLLGRITGLDPASLGFAGDGKKRLKLDKTDASFVDVIHTDCVVNGSGKGLLLPIGHADFYPNYCVRQPGCNDASSCNHARAPELYVESILSACLFQSTPCPLSNITARAGCNVYCSSNCAIMGFHSGNATVHPTGTFYLETNDLPPFCRE